MQQDKYWIKININIEKSILNSISIIIIIQSFIMKVNKNKLTHPISFGKDFFERKREAYMYSFFKNIILIFILLNIYTEYKTLCKFLSTYI